MIKETILVWDVETGPLPDEKLALVKPDFQPAKNLRDPEKIKADVLEREQAWKDRAALSALTGQVLLVGVYNPVNDVFHILFGGETTILREFWNTWDEGKRMVGFNCKEFDIKFLYQRSLVLGITPPQDLFEGRYWNRRIVDLLELWCGYSRDYTGNSLGAVCRACGLGEKNGNGADFAKLLAEDKEAARAYLCNDLRLTAALAQRLGIR